MIGLLPAAVAQQDERFGLPSASAMDRVVNCPGSVSLELICPPTKEEAVTEQGDRIHKALETSETIGLTPEDIKIYSRLKNLEDEAHANWQSEFSIEEHSLSREQRLWINHPQTFKPLCSAKLDLFFIATGRALVIDWKTGFKDATPSESNWQLRTQLVALYQSNPTLKHIRVAIGQSRFITKFDFCDYTLADIQHSERELLHHLWKAEQPDAPRRPGDHCRYCKARGFCKEAAAWSLVPVIEVGNIEAKSAKQSKSVVRDRVSKLSLEACAAIWERSKIANQIFDCIEERLKDLPVDELNQLGLGLKETGSVRECTDAQKLFEILYENGLCTDEKEFTTFLKPALTKMEDVVVPRLAEKKGITQEMAKLLIYDIVSPAVLVKPKSPSLSKLK